MKRFIRYWVVSLSLTLIGCTQNRASVEVNSVTPQVISSSITPVTPEDRTPATSKVKGQRTLKLVKLMEGGVCKDDEQGVSGVFLLYANPEDLQRIRQAEGSDIFKSFETKIQDFSLNAFKYAVNNTPIAISPFALDEDDARNQVGMALVKKFNIAIQSDMAAFEQSHSLSIDIEPFIRSFRFYIDGCEINNPDD